MARVLMPYTLTTTFPVIRDPTTLPALLTASDDNKSAPKTCGRMQPTGIHGHAQLETRTAGTTQTADSASINQWAGVETSINKTGMGKTSEAALPGVSSRSHVRCKPSETGDVVVHSHDLTGLLARAVRPVRPVDGQESPSSPQLRVGLREDHRLCSRDFCWPR